MRKLNQICLSALFIVLFSAMNLHAQPAGDVSPEMKNLGKTVFAHFADTFGFENYVFAGNNGNSLIYEFLPADGSTVDNWQNIATGTLIYIDSEDAVVKQQVSEYIDNILNIPVINVHDKKIVENDLGKIAVIEYDIGEDAQKESNISLIWRQGPNLIANFQVQSRGGAPNESLRMAFAQIQTNIQKLGQQEADELDRAP